MTWLNGIADLATIVTATVAAHAYATYRLALHARMQKLEQALAKKTQPNDDSLTLAQLAVDLVLTEPQVIEAASRSKKVESWAGQSGKEYRFRMKRASN